MHWCFLNLIHCLNKTQIFDFYPTWKKIKMGKYKIGKLMKQILIFLLFLLTTNLPKSNIKIELTKTIMMLFEKMIIGIKTRLMILTTHKKFTIWIIWWFMINNWNRILEL